MIKKSQGFTLVETLTSAAIVVTIVASLAALFGDVRKRGLMMDRLRDINSVHLKISNLLSQSTACGMTLIRLAGAAAPYDLNSRQNRALVTIPPTGGATLVNNAQLTFIQDGRPTGNVAYSRGAVAAVTDQVARGIQITDMRVSNLGPNLGSIADGEQFFFLNITYQISANLFFSNLNYQITKSIPIFLLWGDDQATDAADNVFLGCTSNAHRGINRAYMNVFLPDTLLDNNHYEGGQYSGIAPVAGGAPAVAPVIGPSNSADTTPGLWIDRYLIVRSLGAADTNTKGYISAFQFFILSDELEKSKIQTLSNPLETLNQINVYEYNMKGSNRKEIGFLAQELERFTPLSIARPDGLKAVNYSGVVALQIEAIKELKKKQDSLKLELKNLKKELLDIQNSTN